MNSKLIAALALALALAMGTTVSMAECVATEVPSIPDGASATMKDMIAAQSSVKTFQAANSA